MIFPLCGPCDVPSKLPCLHALARLLASPTQSTSSAYYQQSSPVSAGTHRAQSTHMTSHTASLQFCAAATTVAALGAAIWWRSRSKTIGQRGSRDNTYAHAWEHDLARAHTHMTSVPHAHVYSTCPTSMHTCNYLLKTHSLVILPSSSFFSLLSRCRLSDHNSKHSNYRYSNQRGKWC